ncbi:MAG: ATP-binding protein [Spirochaetales bacterium]|nr:ATP-binding protein [Spirochaetales bacterium]
MRLPFLDREKELLRLTEARARPGTFLLVVYGRRRCGKSRLIEEVFDPQKDVYYLADERDASVQRSALAMEIGRKIRGFERAIYPDWAALLEAWRDRHDGQGVLAIDEFPYLVGTSRELPSVLQKFLDQSAGKPARLLLCGSSQRMMQGLVLDRTAPLYGRATEILKIEPLEARYICAALGTGGEAAVEAYAVWGGMPRNWELAVDYADTARGVKSLVLDRNGVLHREPPRLLLDDMRTAVQSSSILSLIASGCHRLSEIAGRLGRPAADLGRPMGRLIELGYVERHIPFGESLRSTRRTLYRLADPFLQYWYRFVQPNDSLLELDMVDQVYSRIQDELPSHVAEVWEQLARRSVPTLAPGGVSWGPAARWWGKDRDGNPLEIDVVAESLDRSRLLVGEAKWAEASDCGRLERELRDKAHRLPFVAGRELYYALWLKRPSGAASTRVSVFDPPALLA